MNRKLIQSRWCYRCKILSLWISSLHILGFFYIHCILYSLYVLYFENVLQERACTGVGWGIRPKPIFQHWGGWGVKKWPFWGVLTLWMAPYVNVNRFQAKSGQIRNTFESLISREKKMIETSFLYLMIDTQQQNSYLSQSRILNQS